MNRRNQVLRVTVYAAGVLITALGIVLCKRCDWGISPVSCVPFVMEKITGLTFGTMTMYFHAVNICLQMLLRKTLKDKKIWFQFIYAVAFGRAVDMFQLILPDLGRGINVRAVILLLSCVLTGAGMFLTVETDLVQDPTMGAVREIAGSAGRKVSSVKNIYDLSLLAAAAVLGMICLHRITGIGIATVVSALLVGRIMSGCRSLKTKCVFGDGSF